jgi:hypothetical protein
MPYYFFLVYALAALLAIVLTDLARGLGGVSFRTAIMISKKLKSRQTS